MLSGGGVNGVLLELGFLRRFRETPMWPRVGWIYGTSAGALSGAMAALDRLDDLEEFALGLQPDDVFRPRRALLAEVRLAEERAARGEPAHYAEMLVRLMRVAIARNTVLEERLAAERDTSVAELQRLREEVISAAVGTAPKRRRGQLRAELDSIFASARFPFRHDRQIPSLIVRATPGDDGLDPTFRGDEPWPEERKRALIERGYRLADDTLGASADFTG